MARSPSPSPPSALDYRITGDREILQIEARLPDCTELVGDLEHVRDRVVTSEASGCRVRYRFHLAAATETSAGFIDLEQTVRKGDAIRLAIASFALRPRGATRATPVRLFAHLDGGTFETTLARDGDAHVGRVADLVDGSIAMVGRFAQTKRTVGGSTLSIALLPGKGATPDEEVVAWIDRSARTVARYYDGLPFANATLVVDSGSGAGIFGLTSHDGVGWIWLRMGHDAKVVGNGDEWVATHELLHLAFPAVGRGHAWLQEGMATYVEPVARVRTGEITEIDLWDQLFDGVPKGQPREGDQGLERTHTWGRTYWGGALFFLLADVGIREATKGKLGLENALRAIAREKITDVPSIMDIGDRATGTAVLRTLYDRHAFSAVRVDLDALWKRLGVTRSSDTVTLDDQAELAWVRRAITTP